MEVPLPEQQPDANAIALVFVGARARLPRRKRKGILSQELMGVFSKGCAWSWPL